MSNKTKTNNPIDTIQDTATQAGIVLMAAAATLGLMEVPHDPEKRAIVPHQPAFAVVTEAVDPTPGGENMRREREEVHPHYHGYSASQRTPGRTGKA